MTVEAETGISLPGHSPHLGCRAVTLAKKAPALEFSEGAGLTPESQTSRLQSHEATGLWCFLTAAPANAYTGKPIGGSYRGRRREGQACGQGGVREDLIPDAF